MAEINILVNWDERKIYSKEELNEQIEREIKRAVETEVDLEEWLDGRYSLIELFHMDKEEKAQILADYEKYIREKTRNEYSFYYNEYRFETN